MAHCLECINTDKAQASQDRFAKKKKNSKEKNVIIQCFRLILLAYEKWLAGSWVGSLGCGLL